MGKLFNQPIEAVIRARHSIRNYEDQSINQDVLQKIQAYIREISSPFDNAVRVKLIQKAPANKVLKLGTYGVIKGANVYLAGACEKGEFDREALGYAFEKIILYCTALGLGTVWLGGTFNKGEFAKAMEVKPNEIMPIVSPVGYEGGKKSFIASMIGSNQNKRKAYQTLFFENNFNTPLTQEGAGNYHEVLEMVRLAPSAMNKQPWRIVKQKSTYHFYNSGNMDMSKIDMGIALCHFHLTTQEKGLVGEFKKIDPKLEAKNQYVISWVAQV